MVTQVGLDGRISLVSTVAGDAAGSVGDVPSRCSPKRVGELGEDAATRYLEAEGYEVLERNWRCPVGEVDIVARGTDETQAILVEVKTRRVPRAEAPVAPELAVGSRKRARYRTMALIYLSVHPEIYSVRFDVIGVALAEIGESKVRHLVGAYGWDDNL